MTAFPDKTLLVGIGAPKSGTSWLYGYLRDHPQVFMSPIKEMNVWNARFRPDLAKDWNEKFAVRLQQAEAKGDAPKRQLEALRMRVAMSTDPTAYIRFFKQRTTPQHKAFGEVSPGYILLREEGLRALKAQHPRTRLILLMRDPVERLWSALRMRQRESGVDAAQGFDSAITNELMLERGRYDLIIAALDAVFDAADVHLGFYETLFEEASIRALCDFAEVDYAPADFDRHPNVAPEAEMPAHQVQAAREALDPVYAFCRARFGDRVPASWAR